MPERRQGRYIGRRDGREFSPSPPAIAARPSAAIAPPTMRTNCPGNVVRIQLLTNPMNGAESTSPIETTGGQHERRGTSAGLAFPCGRMSIMRLFARLACAVVVSLALASFLVGAAAAQQARTDSPRIEIVFSKETRTEPVTGMVYVAVSRDNRRTPIDRPPRPVSRFSRILSKGWRPGRPSTHYGATIAVIRYASLARPAGRRILDAAVRQRLHAVPARRRPHGLAAHGSVGRPELEAIAGQLLRRSGADHIRSEVARRRSGSSPTRSFRRFRLPADTDDGQADQDSERRFSEVVGTADLSRRHRPAAQGLRQASGRPVSGQLRCRAISRWRAGRIRHAAAPSITLWMADDTPRLIYVTLQHPSPYYDDSYGVNSENNGPYGDAIMQELIPAVEDAVPRDPRAVGAHALRRIDGRLDCARRIRSSIRISTAARSRCCPDAVDFRYHQIVNIYNDTNAYFVDKGWMKVDRPNAARARRQHRVDDEGRELVRARRSATNRDPAVSGTSGRRRIPRSAPTATRSASGTRRPASSTSQSPSTGRSTTCATSSRRTGRRSDRRSRTSCNVYVGDMDSYYLNDAVEKLNEFLIKG